MRARFFRLASPPRPPLFEWVVGRRPIRRTERILIDETVSNITQGEPANTFEDAAARVKAALHATKQTSMGDG